MGLLDNARRAALALAGVQKATPASKDLVVLANQNQGMDGRTPLGPGMPLNPAWGIDQTPRRFDYQPGRNITTRPRSDSRISFSTLRDFIDAYDVAQVCITHRIDSIRALPWEIVPVDGVTENVDRAIMEARRVMAKPDGRTPLFTMLGEYLWDILAYDAGCLYKVRNNAGQAIGLKPIDGTTIAPLLDGWGDVPDGDASAYVQIIHGIPVEWYTYDQLVYEPFRKITNTPYGRAPLEAVIVNASTDVKFQMHFLRNFTSGNIPDMFGILPDGTTPEQKDAWQKSYDAILAGDEDAKSQIKWMPPGVKFQEVNPHAFDKDIAAWFERKTTAAFHMTPQDLGYIVDVNRANGETQEGLTERVGDLPLREHVNGVFTRFLQEDMGLPVEFRFDAGGETEDRLATAQSDKVYVEMGAVSVSDIAEARFGIVDEQKVPRFVLVPKIGPIPLSSVEAASGPVDPETAEPMPGTITPATEADPQKIQALTISDGGKPTPQESVLNEGGSLAAAVAVKSAASVNDERAAFRKFVETRRKRGTWRDFQFRTAGVRDAHELNKLGLAVIRKDAGQVAVAGLAILAEDTGRVLMIQRALDPTDPNQGTWEFPGGHLEAGETPAIAASREWQEEVGVPIPAGQMTDGTWGNGHYQGFVMLVPTEADVPCRIGSTEVLNPDDPDGDNIETVAWWDPKQLVGNPAVRVDLQADISDVLVALRGEPAVEADAVPFEKGWRDGQPKTPMHNYDLQIIDYYQPLLVKALTDWISSLPIGEVAAAHAASFLKSGEGDDIAAGLDDGTGPDMEVALRSMSTAGYLTGSHGGAQQVAQQLGVDSVPSFAGTLNDIDWATWTPGDTVAAQAAADGGLESLLNSAGVTIQSVKQTVLGQLGDAIAEGLGRGDSVDSIANSITDLVDIPGRATMIAATETARAQTAGASGTYSDNGVTEWDLVTADGAGPECTDIEDQNPHPMGDEGAKPPLHPFCRCSMAPVAATIITPNE
jgi:8-oxo-dGTP pyrophosphatase MutT (NUDIX family)